MSTRVKKKRRLIYLAVGLALLTALGAGGYVLRSKQVNARLARSRQEGAAALAAGNHEIALHKVGTYLQRNGDDADALYDYALAREHVPLPDNKHISQAIAQYRRLLVLRPLHAHARRRLLNLYATYGLTKEAIETAGKFPKDDPDALRAKGTSHARQREYAKALEASEAYNIVAPDDLDMQRLTFDVMLAQGQPASDVVARAQALEEKYPNRGRFQLLTGIAHRMAGDAGSAKASVAKAAADEADNDPVFVRTLVEQLEALELFEDSVRVLGRAADQGGTANRRLYVGRLFRAGRYQEVVDRLGDLKADHAAADAELLALRAASLSKLGRPDEAASIAAALGKRFDPGAEAWAPVLGVVFRTPPAPHKDVIRVCTASLRRWPSTPYFHYYLADAYAAVGEQDHAVEHWVQATRLAPAWAAPRARLATAFAAAGRVEQALDLARGARDRGSNDPTALRALADALSASLVAARGTPANPALVSELRATLDKLDAVKPDNDSTPVMRVLASAAEGQRDQAVAAARAALAPTKAFPDGTYLGIAAISKSYELGLEEACLSRWEQVQGRVTPALAAHRARTLLEAGNAAEGRRVLESARDAARGPAEVKAWRTAWAGYLDATADPAAKQAWVSLADEFADDAAVQALALRATSLRDDRAFLDRTVDRLRDASGPEAVAWRLARARWIAAGATGADKSAQLAKAASLLGDLCRDMPDLPEPRILLARCMQELGNSREAIAQLSRVVSSAPQLHGARLELAGLLQAQGDYAEAKSHLDAVADDPSAPAQDRAAAAALLARGGDADKALHVMERLGGTNQPVSSLLLADLYRKQGDPGRAEQICRELVAKSADANAVALLADILASDGRTEEAEQVLVRLEQSTAPAPQKELIRAQYYAARGDRAKALEQFSGATRAAPSSAVAWRKLAKFHLSGGDVDQALAAAAAAAKASVEDGGLRALQRLANTLPAGPEARPLLPLIAGVVDAPADEPAVSELLNAVAQAKQDPAGGAAALLAHMRDIANRHPRALTVQNIAARTLVSAGGRSGAEEGLEIALRAMQNFPGAAEPAEAATAALVSIGRWEEAAAMARQWQRRAPGAPGADIVIANAHLVRRQPADALAVLKPYVRQDGSATAGGAAEAPHAVQATILYCQALVSSHKTAEAEKILKVRLASPQYRGAWLEIAARHVPNPADAVRWIEIAAGHAPQENFAEQAAVAQSWLTLAMRTRDAAHKERAAAAVGALGERAIDSGTATSSDLLVVGILAEGAGNVVLAESAYTKAIQKNPTEAIALNNLAMILAGRGDTAAAAQFAARATAAEQHPRRHSFFDTLATVQEKAEQWEQAIASMRKAMELDPENIGFQIHHAAILSATGDAASIRDANDSVDSIRPEDPRLNETDKKRLKDVRDRAAPKS